MTTRTFNESVAPWRLSWGAIFGGTFVALGVWLLLYAFGLAVGLSAVDRINMDSLRAAGIGTGIWGIISPLIALFCGGYVAARSSGYSDRTVGVLHGAVLWGFTTLLSFLLMGWALSSIVGGVINLGASAMGTAAQTAALASAGGGQQQQQQEGGLMQALGLNTQDLMGPINQQLREQGKPPITAQGLEAAIQDALRTSLRTGQIDQQILISSLAQNTNLSQQDVQQLSNQLQQSYQNQRGQLGQQLDQIIQRAQSGVQTATDVSGAAFWGIFFALLLSLATALVGAFLGVRSKERHAPHVPLAYAQPATP